MDINNDAMKTVRSWKETNAMDELALLARYTIIRTANHILLGVDALLERLVAMIPVANRTVRFSYVRGNGGGA